MKSRRWVLHLLTDGEIFAGDGPRPGGEPTSSEAPEADTRPAGRGLRVHVDHGLDAI